MIESVFLDKREPPEINDLLKQRLDAPCVDTEVLPYGDIWLDSNGQQVIVERKTMGDLLQSISDGRLFNQAADIASAVKNNPTKIGYVVITELPVVVGGFVVTGNRRTSWAWSSVMGALLTVQDMGLGVAFTPEDDYPDMLLRLAARDTGTVKVPPRRQATKATAQERILMSLPRVGQATAQALLAIGGDVGGVWYLLFNDPTNPPEIVRQKILSINELAHIRALVFSQEAKDE